jgi:glutaredoxin-dependent peroxiredoxin
MAMKIEIGQVAPGFRLYDSGKNMAEPLANQEKTVLLLFFPLAFTSVCTKELCTIRDNISSYNNMNALVYGISVDSLYTLAKFKQEQALNFPLLSDFNKEVSTAYGCLYKRFNFEMKDVSKRAAFIIGKMQIVKYAEVLEDAGKLPDFEAITQKLAVLV